MGRGEGDRVKRCSWTREREENWIREKSFEIVIVASENGRPHLDVHSFVELAQLYCSFLSYYYFSIGYSLQYVLCKTVVQCFPFSWIHLSCLLRKSCDMCITSDRCLIIHTHLIYYAWVIKFFIPTIYHHQTSFVQAPFRSFCAFIC